MLDSENSPPKEREEPKVIGTPATHNTDELSSKIKHIDLGQFRLNELNAFRQIMQDTLSLCEEEIVCPHISHTFDLKDVNDAIKFIKEKKCIGKILIALRSDDSKLLSK